MNLSLSTSSLAKAFDVLIPEIHDSISVFISAIFFFTFTEALDICFLVSTTIKRKIGTSTATTSASLHSMLNITISAPDIESIAITRSSGPWCASSVISKRSLVSLLIKVPVLFLS